MKYIESGKYRKELEQAKQTLDLAQELNLDDSTELQNDFDIISARNRTHQAILNALGKRVHVVKEGGPEKAAAFVFNQDIVSGNGVIYVNETTLDNYSDAMHFAAHENMHLRSRFTHETFEKMFERLGKQNRDLLKEALGIHDKDGEFWLEGFNEAATIREHGKIENCAYNDDEVPVALRLEKLCQDKLHTSLIVAYSNREKDLFEQLLHELCDQLQIEKLKNSLSLAA